MTGQAEKRDQGTDAAQLCALVFSNGKVLDRFAMTVEGALKRANWTRRRFEEAVAWAVVSGWVRRRQRHIELTAAGLYVAKSYLDLPR